MKTYRHENTLYFFDPNAHCRSWTLFEIDPVTGYQVGPATYIGNKVQLLIAHPEFKFVPYVEIVNPKPETFPASFNITLKTKI